MSTWEQLLVPTPSCQVAWHGRNPPWGETFKQKLTNHIATNETRRWPCLPPTDWALAEATICTHKSDLWRPLGGFWWAGLSAMVLVYYRYRVWAGHNSVCFACWWCATHLSLSLSLSPAISLSFCLYLYCQLCFEMKNADNCNKSHTHTWRGEATCRAQHKLKNANSFIKIIYDPTDNKKTGHITLRRP